MIRLLIVDKARLICDALAAALQTRPGLAVMAVAASAGQALALADGCDVVLVSASLPGDDALRLVRALGRGPNPVRVVVTGLAEDEVLPYLEAGALGYALREDPVDILVRSVQAAYAGTPLVSPRVTAALMARLAELACHAEQQTPGSGARRLTAREHEVLRLVSQGLSNQEIGERLNIETGTVKNHVHSILRKLNVTSRFEAALSSAPLSAAPAQAAPALSSLPERLPPTTLAGNGAQQKYYAAEREIG